MGSRRWGFTQESFELIGKCYRRPPIDDVAKSPQASNWQHSLHGPAWRALGQRGVFEDRDNLFARHRGITEEEIIDRVTSFDAVE